MFGTKDNQVQTEPVFFEKTKNDETDYLDKEIELLERESEEEQKIFKKEHQYFTNMNIDSSDRTRESVKNKDYEKAIELQQKLIEFLEQQGSESGPKIFIVSGAGANSYITLARYLQLSGKNDEGWKVFNKSLLLNYTKLDDKIEIYNAMRIFLQREGRHKLAVQYGIASYLFDVEKNQKWIKDEIKEVQFLRDSKNRGEQDESINEIITFNISMIKEEEARLNEQTDREVIDGIIEGLLKKTKLLEAKFDLVDIVEKYILGKSKLDIGKLFREIGVVTNKYDS